MKKKKIFIAAIITVIILSIFSYLIFDKLGYCLCIGNRYAGGKASWIGRKQKYPTPDGWSEEFCCPIDVNCM